MLFKPKNHEELFYATALWYNDKYEAINLFGHISKWNTSLITDMSYIFKDFVRFNDDLSNWDVSNVTNMSHMFCNCTIFNCVLNKWDVSNVTNACNMFFGCEKFDQNLNNWNISKMLNMDGMFSYCKMFNLYNIYEWKINEETTVFYMLYLCPKKITSKTDYIREMRNLRFNQI